MKHMAEENRKQQITEILDKTEELLQLIQNSDVYVRYQKELEELKADKETYDKMNEYRRKNLAMQIMEGSDISYEKQEELYTEYKDFLRKPLVNRFMLSEQSICKIMRDVQNRMFEVINLDISYLENEESE